MSVVCCRRSLVLAVVHCCSVTVAVSSSLEPGYGVLARQRSVVRRPFPHRTDCCRSIRRREGVKGGFACTFTGHLSPVLVVL
jgi:hypothetical protein